MAVRNVIIGALFVALVGMMSLTACQSQKKIKSLEKAIEVCRKNNIESYAICKKQTDVCKKRLELCSIIKNRLEEKLSNYEDKLCD